MYCKFATKFKSVKRDKNCERKVKSVHTDDKLYEKTLKCIIGNSMKQSLCSLKCYVWTVLKPKRKHQIFFVCLFVCLLFSLDLIG